MQGVIWGTPRRTSVRAPKRAAGSDERSVRWGCSVQHGQVGRRRACACATRGGMQARTARPWARTRGGSVVGSSGGRGCCRGHTLARMGVRPVVVRPDRQRVGGRCMAGCMHQHTLHGGEPSGSSNVIRTRDTRRAARAGLLAQKTVPCVGCGSGTSHLHTIPGPIGQQRWPRADDLRTCLYCFVTS